MTKRKTGWSIADSTRVFRTRREVREYAHLMSVPLVSIMRTFNQVDSAVSHGGIYEVAPDGSYYQHDDDYYYLRDAK